MDCVARQSRAYEFSFARDAAFVGASTLRFPQKTTKTRVAFPLKYSLWIATPSARNDDFFEACNDNPFGIRKHGNAVRTFQKWRN
ncbi:MAG: hypothetical protein NC548_62255 [Lachnospiraceae bacterium]|nr:hypothetical protein [Lachnospiraceae bacterium]